MKGLGGRPGEGGGAADPDACESAKLHRGFRQLGRDRNPIQDHRLSCGHLAFPQQEQHGESPGRDDHFHPSVHQGLRLLSELGENFFADLRFAESAVEIGHRRFYGLDGHYPLSKAILGHLLFVHGDEIRVDGDERDFSTQGAGKKQAGLSQAEDRNVHRGFQFIEPGVLEMALQEGIITLSFGFQGVVNSQGGAAELRQPMEIAIGGG